MPSYTFIAKSLDADAGFRDGPRGTHTSRTSMTAELEKVMRTGAEGEALEKLVLEANVLEKATMAGRALTLQRLRELYALDRAVPIFRVLSELWARDPRSLPLLALLASLARDPLLRATARSVVGLAPGSELMRDTMRHGLAGVVGGRLNEATLEKVVRNASSTWAQSGHLEGRTFKRRQKVSATPAALAFAIWLAQAAGFNGDEILSSGWVAVLDLEAAELRTTLERARATGLIDVQQMGSQLAIDASRLSSMGAAA